MIRQSSYIISLSLHFLLFFLLYKFILLENIPVPPKKELPVIALTFKKAVKESQQSKRTPLTAKAESRQVTKQKEITQAPQESPEMTVASEPVAEPDMPIVLPEIRGNIIYADPGSFIFEEEPIVQIDDLTLDNLLIEEGSREKQLSHELYTIEFLSRESRRILNYPDILLDYTDPVMATLVNCQISFRITRSGLVEEISMNEPGSGSETYDKIIEDLMVQLLFEPGWEDRGIIFINFALINGKNHE